MKKKLFLLFAAVMLMASCEGPAGQDGQGIYWFVKKYTINSNQWELIGGVDELNSYYRAEIVIPELDNDIYKDGNVFCYMYQKVEGVEVQTLLPYSIPQALSSGGYDEFWTETYAYDFTVGSIMLYVNYSDFYTNNRPPATSFRVVLNY